MRSYMPKVGTMGLDMMFRTCTVQVCGAARRPHDLRPLRCTKADCGTAGIAPAPSASISCDA